MAKANKLRDVWLPVALCILFSSATMSHCIITSSSEKPVSYKLITLAAAVGILWLLITRNLKPLRKPSTLALLGYVLFTFLTAFWAIAGKFFLASFSCIVIALFFYLFIVLRPRFDRDFAYRVMAISAGSATLFAFLGVEIATTGYLRGIVDLLMCTQSLPNIGFSTRLSGVFANSNVEASVYAFGIFFSLPLLCGADRRSRRVLWSAALAINAYAMLLTLSIGAIACFGVAVILYLIAGGEDRCAALTRMLEGALPAFVCATAAFLLSQRGKSALAPLLMLAAAGLTAALELALGERAAEAIAKRARLVFGILIGLGACAVIFFLVALRLGAPHTFGPGISRGTVLSPGEHVLTVDADEGVWVNIGGREAWRMAVGLYDESVYSGSASGDIPFTVSETYQSCMFNFGGPAGTTIRSAVLDGKRSLVLDYRLMPSFLVYRLQNGLTANSSFSQRAELARDGMKMFRLRPLAGNGAGSFETGIHSVQDYYYITRFVHNHYVQILLEDGVIGFAFFAAALVLMVLALWKKRRVMLAGEFRWIYPALCAELAMNTLNMLWDVPMSLTPFLSMIYVHYALIAACCEEPLELVRKEAAEAQSIKKGSKKQAKAQRERESSLDAAGRVVCISLCSFFILTLCGNIYAVRLRSTENVTYEQFLRHVDLGTKIDLYEYNDSLLAYVMAVKQNDTDGSHRAQADEKAAQLAKAYSNSLPLYLMDYYTATGQYARAIDEAMLAAEYSKVDAAVWNRAINLLRSSLLNSGESSPLLGGDGSLLLDKLLAYCGIYQTVNETTLGGLRLSEGSVQFFEKVLALDACRGDTDAMLSVLTGTGA